MTAAPKLADDAERALVKPWNDDDAQSIAYNEYNFDPSLLIPANEVPKGHDPNRYWRPNKRQELFLQNPTWEVFYGGQGGGGKSDALLIDALRFVEHPDHRALLLRRSFVDLTRYIIPRSQQLYPRVGGVWRASAKRWQFPSGATVELGACDHRDNIHRFAGAAYNWIGWDELTHFEESQYLFMFSRLRSASGLPTYYRAASNPGGPGHDWVLERFAPWLRLGDSDYEEPLDPYGNKIVGVYNKPLFFVRNEDGNEVIVPKGTSMARGRSFIPATVHDNPFLANSEYIANMNAMSKLDRARIMYGDWLAKPGAGIMFEGKWFKNPDTSLGDPERPTNTVARLRYWDLAGTEEARAKEGTAFTAGVLMSAEVIGRSPHDGTPLVRVWIEDIVRGQWHPAGVIAEVEKTMDADMKKDPNCLSYVERDPGQAGMFQSWFMATSAGAKGQHLRPVQPQGSKLSRARVPSALAEQGNVWLMPAKWNKIFREELQSFPEGLKDQVDSYTGGLRQLLLLARNAKSDNAARATASTPTRSNPQRNIRRGF